MKERIKKIIPRYAYIPLLTMVIMNVLVYNGSKLFTNSLYHYNASIFIDSYLPFVPFFISFYILAYVQWIIGYIKIAKENKETCYHFCAGEVIAKLLCLFFFLVFPTTIVRPKVIGDGIWGMLTRFIYSADAPVNLFPSIHCLESWMCFRGAMALKKVSKKYKIIMFVFTIFVCMSTVLVKQHVFIDIIGGILMVEIGILITKKFHLETIFEKISSKRS